MARAQQSADDAITDINLTPLVDVCLVLVIIFMAVAPFALQAGIKVLESRASASEGKTALTENVQVVLKEDGSLTVNGKPLGAAKLFDALRDALALSKERMVVITAAEKNRVGQVVEILDTARQAGAVKLAILKENGAPAEAAPAQEEGC